MKIITDENESRLRLWNMRLLSTKNKQKIGVKNIYKDMNKGNKLIENRSPLYQTYISIII